MRPPMSPDRLEYQRQLRNLFAVLRALVRHTSPGQESVAEFATRLESRIGTLARVFDMALRAPQEGVDLQEMIADEFLSQTVPPQHCELGGPQIRIAAPFVTSLALAFHELTLNALMHGALGSRAGLVSVTWTSVQDNGFPWLILRWHESGSALDVGGVRSRGFGLEWIERTLSYELNSRASVEFCNDGVHVEMRIPSGGPDAADRTVWQLGTES